MEVDEDDQNEKGKYKWFFHRRKTARVCGEENLA